MSRQALAYMYTCDRCGEEWEVREEQKDVPKKYGSGTERKTVTTGKHPSRVHFPGIHDGGGGRIKDSEWDVCVSCWSIIRNVPLVAEESES